MPPVSESGTTELRRRGVALLCQVHDLVLTEMVTRTQELKESCHRLDIVHPTLVPILEGEADHAPGSQNDRLHLAEQVAYAALCHRLLPTDGYLLLGSSEAGGVLAESWVLPDKWDAGGFDLQKLLSTAQGGPLVRQTMLDMH